MHLLLSSALLLCASDDSKAVLTKLELQAQILNIFFEDIDAAYIHGYSRGENTEHVCSWFHIALEFHIKCTGEVVTEFSARGSSHGNYRLDMMPNTFQSVTIANCRQNASLNTRTLPAEARLINLGSNLLHGSIELQRLPSKLEKLILSFNRLEGPIFFAELHETIQEIDLRSNQIRQSVVYHDVLPSSLRKVGLFYNGIDKVRCVSSCAKQSRSNVVFDLGVSLY